MNPKPGLVRLVAGGLSTVRSRVRWSLVLRMPMQVADPKWCKIIGTDARAFYYNPEYIAGLTLDQTWFALAHEAPHCALSWFVRRKCRVRAHWDITCDLPIIPILIKDNGNQQQA